MLNCKYNVIPALYINLKVKLANNIIYNNLESVV